MGSISLVDIKKISVCSCKKTWFECYYLQSPLGAAVGGELLVPGPDGFSSWDPAADAGLRP